MPSDKKPKRRLKNIRVDRVALVDNPAVPEATFVIAKRDEEADEQLAKAKPESVKEGFLKAIDTLKSLAKDMNSGELQILGGLMDFAEFNFGFTGEMDDDVMNRLNKARSLSLVSKDDEPEEEATEDAAESSESEPEEEPEVTVTADVEAVEPETVETSVWDDVAAAIEPPPPTEQELVAQLADQLESTVATVTEVAEAVATVADQSNQLHERVNTATGIVAD